MLDANDSSFLTTRTLEEVQRTHYELRRPSVFLNVDLFRDGDKWCAMYPARRDGGNLTESVCGFAEIPDNAMREFDLAFHGQSDD